MTGYEVYLDNELISIEKTLSEARFLAGWLSHTNPKCDVRVEGKKIAIMSLGEKE